MTVVWQLDIVMWPMKRFVKKLAYVSFAWVALSFVVWAAVTTASATFFGPDADRMQKSGKAHNLQGYAAESEPQPKTKEQRAAMVAQVGEVTRRVYRLLVEVEGAIKGGTAFLVSGKRIIATNHHVVDKGNAFTVGYLDKDGLITRLPARVIATFPQKDLALLEVLDDLPGEPLTLAINHPAAALDLAAIGFPAAADPQGVSSWTTGDDETFFLPSVLKGSVSRVLTNRWLSSQLQHQTPIIAGYSGGPLVNDDGQVVGISTAIHKDANGISYAVLAADLAEFASACALPVKSEPASRPNRDELLMSSLPHQNGSSDVTASLGVRQDIASELDERVILRRANELLEYGDIAAARLLFEYLVSNGGTPESVTGLAKTYDPSFLYKKNVIGVVGNRARAVALYAEAEALNYGKKPNLTRSGFGTCENSTCKLINGTQGPLVICEKASRN